MKKDTRIITDTDKRIYWAIVLHKITHDGESPSYRHIKEIASVTSTSVISYSVNKLHDLGLIIAVKNGKVTKEIHLIGGGYHYETPEIVQQILEKGEHHEGTSNAS